MGRDEANVLDEIFGSIRRLGIGDRHNPLIREAIRAAAAAAVRELAVGGTRLVQHESARLQKEDEVEVGTIDCDNGIDDDIDAEKSELNGTDGCEAFYFGEDRAEVGVQVELL
eukprot:8471707-Alexandrium_andersonii.AAC.1